MFFFINIKNRNKILNLFKFKNCIKLRLLNKNYYFI